MPIMSSPWRAKACRRRAPSCVNNQVASLIDDSEPPQYARYVQHLRRILLDDLRFKERDVLVLGAGGFTLSHRERTAIPTSISIRPSAPLPNATFCASRPAAVRRHRRTPLRDRNHAAYDAVVVDVYSSRSSIPNHLVTREFWRDTRHAEARRRDAGQPDPRRPVSPAATRNLLATIESAYGRCASKCWAKAATSSNVIVTCFAGETADATRICSTAQPGRHRQRRFALTRDCTKQLHEIDTRKSGAGDTGMLGGERESAFTTPAGWGIHYDPRQPIRSRRSSVQEADNQLFR